MRRVALATIAAVVGGAVAAAAQLPAPLGGVLLDAARESFVQALQVTAVIGAAVLAGIAVLVLLVLRRAPAAADPATVGAAGEPVFDAACAD